MIIIRVLVACEESQAVCSAFRARGHEAYSCDILEPSGGHPEWHILGDALPYINGNCSFRTMDGQEHFIDGQWDLLIAHPPCTYLTRASAVRMRVNGEINQQRLALAMEARAFFMSFINADCEHIAVENPVPLRIVDLPPYQQIIQPWWFGHAYTKKTCLWLKNLPPLKPTDIVTEGVQPYVNGGNLDAHGNYRQFKGRNERDPKTRAKTFKGIAEAMADQWGDLSKS